MASGSRDSKIIIWNTETFSCNKEFECRGEVNSLAFNKAGNLLACGSQAVELWNIETN